MKDEITHLTNEYHNWVRRETTLRETEDCVEITTPFLDRHNDMMQIYAKVSGDEIILSDDGYTIEDLEFCGFDVDKSDRPTLIEQNLNGFGVQREGKDLMTRATAQNFAVRMHSLLQAMIAIDDLHYLATPPKVSRRFDKDIEMWLNVSEITFDSKTFKGRSGYEVNYKYVIPPSSNMPQRMLVGINAPDRRAVEQAAFRWQDIRDKRPGNARLYPILNDSQRDSIVGEMDALRNLDINPVLWSDRESVRAELAA